MSPPPDPRVSGRLSIQTSNPGATTSCRTAALLPTISMHCKDWVMGLIAAEFWEQKIAAAFFAGARWGGESPL
jgi:hypothetical protein